MKKLFCGVIILLAALNALPVAAQTRPVPPPPASGPDIAVLISPTTTAFFAAHYPQCGDIYPAGSTTVNTQVIGGGEYERYWRGWEYVLINAGLAFDHVTDVSHLSNYKLLIIPNGVNLSDADQKIIDTWV